MVLWQERSDPQGSEEVSRQPARGARDLLPQDVQDNRWLCARLHQVYRRWGYKELAPPTIERLDTLEAAGAIDGNVLLKVSSQDALGLRPEITASVARAACTRLAGLPRPLRLWYEGSVFQREDIGGHERVQEELQSGIELIGAPGLAGDGELVAILLDACRQLPFHPDHQPTLLLGHSALFVALLADFPTHQQAGLRQALSRYDVLQLQALDLSAADQKRAQQLLSVRGEPGVVLDRLSAFSKAAAVNELRALVELITERARQAGVRLQLDPTFLPTFTFYDGVVLRLVCQGAHALVPVATGGRYNRLLRHFAPGDQDASGTGFSFKVERLRRLLQDHRVALSGQTAVHVLVTYEHPCRLGDAMACLERHHRAQVPAELLPADTAGEPAQGHASPHGPHPQVLVTYNHPMSRAAAQACVQRHRAAQVAVQLWPQPCPTMAAAKAAWKTAWTQGGSFPCLEWLAAARD
ncbi:MAG: ATP phosphoribosyltransferase regulatory subunit [Synechococcus sp. SB0676_bin_10]|uniref:ATP phosphoribosyltransferase regulatory subunit n=1 Tax=Synechococcus sp. SB0676_bin_10 TaxID=2604869 RepID=A0A6B1F7M9_9SYNE|nr:ATP phosphoribosyltransferase regulatory subunit [Cyanobacteria bacterium MAG IRC3_bin_20]MDE0648385.1 ATP phosphoribosyltransferase regulatory subunit [Cyanobacteria bacterium MAG IRC4_bin_6]MYG38177.1 ATP phosphoribosyltransferase regulatory subunit [Synechococcus sp. SB0676_bin_10]